MLELECLVFGSISLNAQAVNDLLHPGAQTPVHQTATRVPARVFQFAAKPRMAHSATIPVWLGAQGMRLLLPRNLRKRSGPQ